MNRLVVAVALALAGCATQKSESKPAAASSPATSSASVDRYDAIAGASDRTGADRALDPGRKPAAFLRAMDVAPGMKVGELFAGGGYTTELLARAVGPTGHVYAENPKWVLEKFGGKGWADRLARPVNANVTREDTELDAPFPGLDGQLDLVVTNANYHDAVWMKVDRAQMNRAVFAALKPGGRYVVSDSSAKPGTGLADVQTLHRIDEASVTSEVEAAGFKLAGHSDALRNPADTRDWSASPHAAGARRGTNDRFILIFAKP